MVIKMKSEMRNIESLIPYARNSRTHSERQVEQLAASIDEFGLVGAVVVRDGTIAKGHGTLQAVRKLIGASKPIYPAPGRKAKPAPDPYEAGMVPVIDASGWSEAQFRAYVIADNKLAMNSGWDEDLLKVELEDLDAVKFDLGVIGFDLAELESIMLPEMGDEEGPESPDDFKEVDENIDTEHECPKCGYQWSGGK